MYKHKGMYSTKGVHCEVSNGALATVASFSKCSLECLKELQLFCLMPPSYRGVACHSAAKCKITLARVPFEPIKTSLAINFHYILASHLYVFVKKPQV